MLPQLLLLADTWKSVGAVTVTFEGAPVKPVPDKLNDCEAELALTPVWPKDNELGETLMLVELYVTVTIA